MARKRRITFWIMAILMTMLIAAIVHYRQAIRYYVTHELSDDDKLHLVRNFQVMSQHKDQCLGFDVSQYQGQIDWTKTDTVENTFKLHYVFIRATAGYDAVDKRFLTNWNAAGQRTLLRGAYHYYRPDENSVEQAYNFIRTVKLKKGDLPPVLDIEQLPEDQPVDSLKKGLKRWLWLIEKHYGVKPIIYSGNRFYNDFLCEDFKQYPVWIANYNFFVESMDSDWEFWQFSERGFIPGIEGDVDLNLFKGNRSSLDKLRIR